MRLPPNAADTVVEFVVVLLADQIALNLETVKNFLENFSKEYPDAPRRDPKDFVDGSLIERLKQEKFVENLKL